MEKVHLQYVSGSMFDTFGLRPAVGRLLDGKDDLRAGRQPLAVLSYDYWKRRFGRDPGALGRTFRIGNDVFQIVGVAAEPFTGTEPGRITDVFVPITMKDPRTLAGQPILDADTVATPREVPSGPVRERLRATFRVLQEERAKGFHADRDATANDSSRSGCCSSPPAPDVPICSAITAVRWRIGILVALVLLIACANVANLMTAQAAARAREMALRVSIGAGRWRLVQLIVIESAWLALLATAAGGLFAWWSAPFILGMISSRPITGAPGASGGLAGAGFRLRWPPR